MPIFGGNVDYSPARRAFSPAAKREAISELNRSSGGPLSDLFWLLDMPGAIARGTISGIAKGDPALGLRTALADADERVDGREMLGDLGLDPTPGRKTWKNFGVGLAAEILTDPLSMVSGPIKALTPAGKVASKAGLLQNAGEALSRKYIQGEATGAVADLAEQAVKRIGRDVSPTDIIGRPLIGARAARRHGTLGDLIDYAPDPEMARRDALAAMGGDSAALEALRSSPLGRDIGFGLPLVDPVASISVPGGSRYAGAADALGEALRWSPAGRLLGQLMNPAVGGAYDANEQMMTAGARISQRRAEAAGRRAATYEAGKLRLAEPDVFSEEGNRSLGRSIERPVENAHEQADNVWQSSHPAARQYMQWWDEYAKESPQRFQAMGLRGAEFADPNIAGYLPRSADGALEQAGQSTPSLGRVLSTMTSDQLRRSKEMMVPGGRDTIAFDLSRDPFVAGTKRTAKNDAEAASYIQAKLSLPAGKGGQNQAQSLAALLHRLPDHLIKEVPLYGQHPVEMITRYVEGREGAAAMQGALFDSLAYNAARTPAALADGGRHISLKNAIERVSSQAASESGAMEGAVAQLRDRVAKRFGVSPDSVSLSSLSIPEDVVDRLARTAETYTSAKATEGLMKHLENYNNAWKSSILSWPSKFVRDFYSGGYSNWLEGAASLRGTASAYGLLTAGPQSKSFLSALRKTPLYSTADDDAIARFWSDLSAEGLLETGLSMDRAITISGGRILNTMPGSAPDTLMGALSELGPQRGRTWRQYASDIAPRIAPTREQLSRGPVARFGAKAGNLVDKINRLSGYMELLMQGVAPQEAARRMKRAHVDYASLTPAEKWFRDRFMPFYAYTSRSLQEVLRQMAEQPGGRYAQGLRTYERAQQRDDGGYTPSYLRQSFAAPVASDTPILGTDAPGITRYLTDIDLPGYDQINMLEYSDGYEMMRRAGQMMSPLARTAAEFGTGVDMFTGQDLRKGTSGPLAKIGRAVTGDQDLRVNSVFEKLYDLTPGLSRPTRAIAQAVDPTYDIDLPSRLAASAISNTLGVKIRDVSREEEVRDQIRRLRDSAAAHTREFATPYVTDEMRPRVPRSALDALDLASQLDSERRKANKPKGKKRSRRD